MKNVKVGMKVKVKSEEGFWYTVKKVEGENVVCTFGKSGGYAGTFPMKRLKRVK